MKSSDNQQPQEGPHKDYFKDGTLSAEGEYKKMAKKMVNGNIITVAGS